MKQVKLAPRFAAFSKSVRRKKIRKGNIIHCQIFKNQQILGFRYIEENQYMTLPDRIWRQFCQFEILLNLFIYNIEVNCAKFKSSRF